jgi:putative ABC transport system permease protein
VIIIDDLRYARRALRAHALVAAAVTLILSVAVGANTAVFALVNSVLLSPLPFRDPSQLVTVQQTRADSPEEPLSIPDYRDLRDANRAFAQMAAAFQWSANVTGGEAERVQGMKASASLFSMLGASAALGRTLLPEDEEGSGRRVVMLTYGYWVRRFGANPGAVGSSITLNGDSHTIVGVLPAAFITPVRDAELVAPFPMETDPRRALRDAGFLRVVARLRPGVTPVQAQADLDSIMQRLRITYPGTNATHLGTRVTEWRRALVARQRPVLLLLQGAVILVLLVACANVANLFLASALRREHEFALRAALGASRRRLVRQVLSEAGLIAAAACAGGLLIQDVTRKALVALAPPDLIALTPADASNPRVLAFSLALATLTALAFGAAPALRLSAAESGTSLRGARGASPSNRRLRTLFVAVEVALASALVTLALLLSQSVARLQAVDPGFDAPRVLTMRLSLPRTRYRRPADAQRFVEMLRPRLMALPGVIDAAAVNVVPLNGYHATADVWPASRPAPSPDQRPQAEYRMVSPSYLRTFGIPLLAGRSFEEADNGAGEPVVLISRTLARRFWDVGTAVGQMIAIDDSDQTRRARIVGVVGDVKHYGLDAEMTPDIYVPIPQVPEPTIQWLTNNMYWGIRASTDPAILREAVRRELRAVDPDVPASAMRTMEEALSLALAPRRVSLWLVRAFAMIALLLAAAGVYAVTAFSVTLRARELAIRAALGARRDQNVRSVLVEAMRPIGAGLVAGAAVALAAVPALGAVLFGVEAFAAAPVILVSATLLVVGLAAASAAARPVRRIDPIDALKAE